MTHNDDGRTSIVTAEFVPKPIRGFKVIVVFWILIVLTPWALWIFMDSVDFPWTWFFVIPFYTYSTFMLFTRRYERTVLRVYDDFVVAKWPNNWYQFKLKIWIMEGRKTPRSAAFFAPP